MFQVEANSKQIPWLHSPIVYNQDKYSSLVDGLVLFGFGNDDLPAHCQILSAQSSFISALADLLIVLFVVTVHTSRVPHALHIWVHWKWEAAVSPLRGDGTSAHQGRAHQSHRLLFTSLLRSPCRGPVVGRKTWLSQCSIVNSGGDIVVVSWKACFLLLCNQMICCGHIYLFYLAG